MTPLAWFGAAAAGSWLAIAGVFGERAHPEVLYGMLGPLAAACGTWIAVERTYRSRPERLTAVMVAGLAVKALFFGVYVAGMLRGLDVRPTPFVISFTGYFVALYGMEALFLKRLFTGGIVSRASGT